MKSKPGMRWLSTALAGTLVVLVMGCQQRSEALGTPPPGTTVGTVIDDSVLTTMVKTALLDNRDVKSLALKVETRKGEVQLSGFADNQTQIDRAVAIAGAVAGVSSVSNKVDLKGAPRSVGDKVDDGMITAQVKAALLADPAVKSLDIAVATRVGEVQLSGFVDNQSQLDRALEVARGIAGVSTVKNEMSLKK